jgi:hypothetical protein
MSEEPRGRIDGHAVLDVGGDIGALVLYTDARLAEAEIEISPEDDVGARVHTAIHERPTTDARGRPVYAGIYPDLRAGRYRIWAPEPGLRDRVTVRGGEIAEVDWRTEEPAPGR